MSTEKRIELCELPVKDLKLDFGNPRKITAKKKRELQNSLEKDGDFGVILINEKNQVIAGNQRVTIMKENDENTVVVCKRLIGYTVNELRGINIKDNTHSGDWDLDLVADWTAGFNTGLENHKNSQPLEDRKTLMMEPINYEKYDFVVIVCRNEIDYNNLTEKLGIQGKKVRLGAKKTVKARAVWFDDTNL